VLGVFGSGVGVNIKLRLCNKKGLLIKTIK